MDIGKSFGYIFQDKDWLKKVLIGSLILVVSIPFTVVLIGFLGLAIVSGYSLEVLRNVRQGSTHPLPEWRDKWSEWLILGLKLWLALFVWSLPALVLSGFNGLGNRLMWTDSDLLGLFGGMMVAVVACLSLLWWIVVALATPAITIRMAETADIGSAFKVDSLYVFTKRHIGEVIIAVLVTFAASIVAVSAGTLAGILLCFVGWVITIPAGIFIANLVSMHLYAQVGMHDTAVAQPVVEPSPAPAGSAAQTPTQNTMVVAPDGSIVVTPSETSPGTGPKTSG
jgi:hypothetical protein